MCPSAPRVCSEPGVQKPLPSLSLDLIVTQLRFKDYWTSYWDVAFDSPSHGHWKIYNHIHICVCVCVVIMVMVKYLISANEMARFWSRAGLSCATRPANYDLLTTTRDIILVAKISKQSGHMPRDITMVTKTLLSSEVTWHNVYN